MFRKAQMLVLCLGINTHFRIYLIERVEHRTITTDCDGKKKTTSNWMFLPGSEKITEIHSGQEYGWTLAYEREV